MHSAFPVSLWQRQFSTSPDLPKSNVAPFWLVLPEGITSTVQMRIHDEERALVRAAKSGDQDAFSGLVRLHQRRAYLVARAIVTVHEDAEDALQDGFVRAFQALDRFDPARSFGAWLNKIVANAALDLTRRRKVRHT